MPRASRVAGSKPNWKRWGCWSSEVQPEGYGQHGQGTGGKNNGVGGGVGKMSNSSQEEAPALIRMALNLRCVLASVSPILLDPIMRSSHGLLHGSNSPEISTQPFLSYSWVPASSNRPLGAHLYLLQEQLLLVSISGRRLAWMDGM